LPVGTIRALKGWRAEVSKTVETYRRGEVDWLVGCVPDGYIAQLVDWLFCQHIFWPGKHALVRANPSSKNTFGVFLIRGVEAWRGHWNGMTPKNNSKVSCTSELCGVLMRQRVGCTARQFNLQRQVPFQTSFYQECRPKRETYSYRTAWFDFFRKSMLHWTWILFEVAGRSQSSTLRVISMHDNVCLLRRSGKISGVTVQVQTRVVEHVELRLHWVFPCLLRRETFPARATGFGPWHEGCWSGADGPKADQPTPSLNHARDPRFVIYLIATSLPPFPEVCAFSVNQHACICDNFGRAPPEGTPEFEANLLSTCWCLSSFLVLDSVALQPKVF
jgi:hypothetical protein